MMILRRVALLTAALFACSAADRHLRRSQRFHPRCSLQWFFLSGLRQIGAGGILGAENEEITGTPSSAEGGLAGLRQGLSGHSVLQ